MKTIILIETILRSTTAISDKPNRIIEPEMYADHIDNLRQTYGHNKVFLAELELASLIGHEYTHILDYESMSMWQIAKMGTKYSSKKFKMALERKIDRVTINRGLGWQLRDWAEYSMETCNASNDYKAFKKRTYLNKNQIVDYMEQNETYDQSFLNENRN